MIRSLDEVRLGVIGLGYVGLPLAVEFGKHREVVGFDIDPRRIEGLRQGYDYTKEIDPAGLGEARYLRLTADLAGLRDCNFFIVTVPTPLDDHNRPDLTPLIKASQTIGSVLKRGDVVVYESTVFPGCTEEECVPILEAVSGLRFNEDFFVGYSPERINPGDKQHRFTSILKVTSGSTPEAADLVDAVYRSVVLAGTHKAPSIKVAEAAKVIENTQRDLNIALMNELSVLFARLGIDTLDVLKAAGTKWNFLPFRPGLVGGHCIGVDPFYLTHKAEQVGYNPQVILAGRRLNDNMGRYVARTTVKFMVRNGINVTRATVGVLGLTFKENCPDIRNSKAVDIVRELQDFNIRVIVDDPHADPEEVAREYPDIQLGKVTAQTPVDSLIVAVAHDEYAACTPDQLRSLLRGSNPILADVKGIYAMQELADLGISVWRL
ncbi:nucleotide sugar dehydrogenase [Pedomonas mirosovicensis]|uniref:nucleotide sugar dehydrogenase n=1 Tax=Pedomonas mirosovicensis TaxID=2908641 RepID=UPI00216A9C0F|nr:nucleotide sugar dehydrogenase [Pedomonas mirosovicensis]MCH8684167.1 nucleotide sugar dehydrogenase [Pedomonas mirosovicensis]